MQALRASRQRAVENKEVEGEARALITELVQTWSNTHGGGQHTHNPYLDKYAAQFRAAKGAKPGQKKKKKKKGRVAGDVVSLLLHLHDIFPDASKPGPYPFSAAVSEAQRSDTLTLAVVKRAYRKAMLVVHPDKQGGAVQAGGMDRTLLATVVFEELRTAYQQYEEAAA